MSNKVENKKCAKRQWSVGWKRKSVVRAFEVLSGKEKYEQSFSGVREQRKCDKDTLEYCGEQWKCDK